MSWLFTMIFAGLMVSSNGDGTSPNFENNYQKADVPAVIQTQDETERFEQTYPISANGRVSISNVNGSITAEAWDRNEIKLAYVKTADTKERLADVEVKIDARQDSFKVETDYGSWKDRNGDRARNSGRLQVEYRLMIPRGAVLNEIETVNGSVTVSNFVNITKISAVNGHVYALNLRGAATLSTVNGEVVADFDRLETGTKINLSTVNGKVNLVIPSDSSATVKADSLNGNISNDFGLPVRKGRYVGRDLYGRIGNGDVNIHLSSVNGALAIGHKNDGKSLSPAVDLLPQKKDGDDDWDKDTDNAAVAAHTAKMNKDIAKAVKATEKATVAASVEANAEAQKIQSEFTRLTAETVARAAETIEQTAQTLSSADFKEKIKDNVIKQKNVLAGITDTGYMPRIEKKSELIPVKGVPKITIDAKGCAVRIRGWDRPEVQYTVIQYTVSSNRIPLKISVDHTDSAVNIKIQKPGGDASIFDQSSPRIEIFVPRKSNLKISSKGEIRLEEVSGDVDLTGGDESINIRDGDGSLHVTSADGRIRVVGFSGEVVAESSDGMVNLEGDFRKLTARTGDGEVFLTIPDNTQANLESNCSEIRGEGIDVSKIGSDGKLSKYRLGKGGAAFRIETDGDIHIRAASILKTSF